jgi:hypothetical protein
MTSRNEKAAVVSQGGLLRAICDSSRLAAPPIIEPADLGRMLLDPRADHITGAEQTPGRTCATGRYCGPHRWWCLANDQHDFAKVNFDV